jgi:putative mRNA 3-end processing factor
MNHYTLQLFKKQYDFVMDLVNFTEKGIYCCPGDFYIDPWKPVERAIITHAHSDHARAGNKFYLCHHLTKPLLQLRLGDNMYQSVEWGEPLYLNGVRVTLHPAGHIIGSSQVRIEYQGEVWVISGDYKVENDGLSGAFEPVPCNYFVTESTFGLPIYVWKPQQQIFFDIQNWIIKNKEEGKISVVIAYSLGKAQRLLSAIAEVNQSIFVHGAIFNINEALRQAGIKLPEAKRVLPHMPKDNFKGSVILAPQSAEGTTWMKRFVPYEIAACSGWMQVRGNARRSNLDKGFALSDHADWRGLLATVEATGAQKVFVTHGFQSAFSRFLNEKGIEASEITTSFGGEEEVVQESIEVP